MNQEQILILFRDAIIEHFNNSNFTERLYENYYIPEDFWEPVKVTLSNNVINSMKELHQTNECTICSDTKDLFKEMPCCKNKICDECTIKWFNESVCCPYCKKDIRELDLKK